MKPRVLTAAERQVLSFLDRGGWWPTRWLDAGAFDRDTLWRLGHGGYLEIHCVTTVQHPTLTLARLTDKGFGAAREAP